MILSFSQAVINVGNQSQVVWLILLLFLGGFSVPLSNLLTKA
jgi:hypothetical protein